MRWIAFAALLLDISPPAQGLNPKILDHVRKYPLEFSGGTARSPLGVAVSPSSSRGAVVGSTGKILILDLDTGKRVAEIDGKSAVSAAFGRDNLLAAGTQKGTVFFLSGEKFTTETNLVPMPANSRPVTGLLFSPGGKFLAAQDGQRMALIDVGAGKVLSTQTFAGEQMVGWAFDSSERRLFVLPDNGKLLVIDTSDGAVSQTIPKPAVVTAEKLNDPEVDAMGRLIAYRDSDVCVVNVAAGGEVHRLAPPGSGLQGMMFLENGSYLAAYGRDEIRLYSTTTWKLERALTIVDGETEMIAAAAGANRMVSVDTDGGLRVWGLRSKKDAETKRPGFIGIVWSAKSDGVFIRQIREDSPASRADLKEGDYLREIDGAAVATSDEVIATLKKHVEGDVVTLTIDRAGEKKPVKVTLGARIE